MSGQGKPSSESAQQQWEELEKNSIDEAFLFYPVQDDFQTEARKQAAAEVLLNYSQFAMVCVGKGVEPSHLKMHLMKEISGIPTRLGAQGPAKHQNLVDVASSSSAGASKSEDDPRSMEIDDQESMMP